ncbi:dephospho-CoA kinase [Desulfobacterota bacterium AH_259_B03_O07]|nr:dephospho-CoA kinase [Desulfobacterota bacterium AH_259_B03_O07]
MKIIGLSGNIASGKTEVANYFKDLGAKLIDADQIAREIVKRGEDAWQEITNEFGREILNSDETINRKKLGEIIFTHEEKREKLNKITHPKIMAKIKERIESYKKERVKVVIIEAALIAENGGLKNLLDYLIVVTADEETQISRIAKRDNLTREDALSRIHSQMPTSEKIKHATFVIDNSGSLAETRKQAGDVWYRINS